MSDSNKSIINRAKDITWEDIASALVGNGKLENISTGSIVAGAGLTGYGLIAGDDGAVVDGLVVGGIGAAVRVGNIGYRVYKAFWGDKPQDAPKVEQLKVTKEQAEEQLGLVDAAKSEDPQRALIMDACKQLYGMDLNAFVQIESKIKENRANKPEVKLWNGAVRFAELQASHV